MKTIWVLSDGRPGHYNQSLAAAKALETLFDESEVRYKEVEVKKAGKYLLRALLNRRWGREVLKALTPQKAVTLFYKGVDLSSSPDIVISAGKDTSMLNALLGLWYGATTLFIGHPKKLDNRLFTKVLTVLDLGFENQIVLDVAPTLPYSGDVEVFCREHGLDPKASYSVLLIGGDGSGYRYTEEEIDALIAFVNKTAEQTNWLVTTSRRTPLPFEEKMQRQMHAKMFVPYHQTPLKAVGAFLALADRVYVTEESASMVSEAVASGKPVVTLMPNETGGGKDYIAILQKFEKAGQIRRYQMKQLQKADIFTRFDMHVTTKEHRGLATRLKSIFQGRQ
jgi:mitochondrial fission protein ELM1